MTWVVNRVDSLTRRRNPTAKTIDPRINAIGTRRRAPPRTFIGFGRRQRTRRMPPQSACPNGICFSPDYKKVYVADTGAGREMRVWDVDGKTVRNGKRFAQLQ